MEVELKKQWPLEVTRAQAWAVLSDVRAVAACMPGAEITEQVDQTHFKGQMRTRVGPAQMLFGGDIEVLALDAESARLEMLGKGADRGGSTASMRLAARLEPGEGGPASCALAGDATVTVSGKLAQFGGRLLVPVADAMLAQFVENFRAAAAARTPPAPPSGPAGPDATPDDAGAAAPATAASSAPPPSVSSSQAPPPPAKELNALGLIWTVIRNWLAGLFGKKAG
jgi:carbon monoxide dehydrogenase subunit G